MSVDAYHNRAGLNQSDVFATSWDWKGNNRQKGLFILNGPGVRPCQVSDARIVDLVPTILRLYQVSAPADLDGRVLVEALKGELVTALPVAEASLGTNYAVEVDGEFDDIVRKRLEALGYL
jgi:hypothetical protein